MSRFSEFLHPTEIRAEKEIYISSRFVKRDAKGEPVLDQEGNPVLRPFKIQAVMQEENEALIRSATITTREKTGAEVSRFDRNKYSRGLVVAGTVDPDFRNREFCDEVGVADPSLIPVRILYAGAGIFLNRKLWTILSITPTPTNGRGFSCCADLVPAGL